MYESWILQTIVNDLILTLGSEKEMRKLEREFLDVGGDDKKESKKPWIEGA